MQTPELHNLTETAYRVRVLNSYEWNGVIRHRYSVLDVDADEARFNVNANRLAFVDPATPLHTPAGV